MEIGFVGLIILLASLFGPLVLGSVLIRERQVGIVIKKFSTRKLPPGRLGDGQAVRCRRIAVGGKRRAVKR